MNNIPNTPAAVSYHSESIEHTAQQLEAEITRGLPASEAKARLARYGNNELPEAARTPLWKLFLQQFNDFIVILLIAASVISALLGDEIEAVAIMAIVILNAAIGLIQEHRADQALEALKKMAAPDAFVLRDGARTRVPARELVPGDIVFLEAGNYIPADVRLVEAHNLQVDEAALTGESEPVTKRANVIVASGAPIGDRLNAAFSSTMATYGRGIGMVTATGQHTEIGAIARMLGEIEEESTPLQKRLNQLGKTLSIVALTLCLAVFVLKTARDTDLAVIASQGIGAYLQAYSKSITEFFILAVSLAVAAVPEGLAAVVTINLALGMREMVKRNALIRRLSAVETLGSATTICTDKTGTLTQNAMNVVRMFVASGQRYEVTGEQYQPKGEIRSVGARRTEDRTQNTEHRTQRTEHREQNTENRGQSTENRGQNTEREARRVEMGTSDLTMLLRGALLCSDAVLEASGESQGQSTYRMVGDPTEGALVVAAAKAGLWRADAERDMPRVAEAPFDAERKMMSTVHAVESRKSKVESRESTEHRTQRTEDRAQNTERVVFTKGAPDMVLARCASQWMGGAAVPLSEADRERILAENADMASGALRVLAVATRTITTALLDEAEQAGGGPALARLAEQDMTFVGLMGMIDPPRPEVGPAIETARVAGIRTIMITGDYPLTARAIAKQIGLVGEDRGQSTEHRTQSTEHRTQRTEDRAQNTEHRGQSGMGSGQWVAEADVVTGAEIQVMDDAGLAERARTINVFARVSPEHKVRIVSAVRANGNVVAMTGDGVNDAPALKRADIGVAMGITGTDVSKETADMVLTDDNYASIVSAVEQGRIIYSNIRKFVFYLLGCNVAEIFIILGATLLGLKSPLAAIQLLWLNLMTDGAPALALGLEKGDPDVMRVPPRPVKEPIINRRMVLGMATQTVALTVAVLGVYMIALQQFPAQAETMGFAALAFAELPLAYTSRSERYSLLKTGPFSNRTMQIAVLSSLVGMLAVLYVPFLNPVFDTVPLGLEHWALLLPAVLVPAIVAELTKVLARKIGLH